jgi:hypothetical protein
MVCSHGCRKGQLEVFVIWQKNPAEDILSGGLLMFTAD